MLELFAHNQAAYDSAVSLLSETGKAAVIHPTGTGKSFIGFRLCADHPDRVICWLSPSEYIFKTQLENLSKVSGGWQPSNIRFFTYARLMNLTKQELAGIQPDYIILDEFHRCGAQEWGKGVAALRGMYAEVPILGLSATNIRYLDNQRDMADELFDGNIASEMTLGEAIVRGILAAPKYVLSVFSYQKQLETYERRVWHARSRAVRETAEQYLDALRRALEKADGLDTVFAKHMTERTGKYIVFCASLAHMREMVDKAGEWFAKVDPKPHLYTVYSDDPSASQSFQDFKADHDPDHLKLLYCIDALNEGVHVDDVSGVILLRPTVSPILYKQQIGRALAAGKREHPVIFDIVLNIENLYSIGAIEEEMQIAMTYYRSLGMGGEIVNEHFRIVDEVRDCRALFDRLNDTLTASWELMYRKAKDYTRDNGDLDVPKRYLTPDGYTLGAWIHTQRLVRAGKTNGRLTDAQIEKLDAIGMRWDSARDAAWERYYAAAKAYYGEHGNLLVNIGDNDYHGVALGRWIAQLRVYRKNGLQSAFLTGQRIQALDAIGMVWNVFDYLWLRYYAACAEYSREHGDLDVPLQYVSKDGTKLGQWIHNIRNARKRTDTTYRLLPEQIQALDALGMLWDRKSDRLWQKGYSEAVKYRREHGNLAIPTGYKTADGYRLGAWISDQREKADMPEHRKRLLEDLGMIWKKPDSWEVRYALAKAYYDVHGDLNIPPQYKVNGVWLSKWVNEQRQIYIGNRGGKCLTADQIARLNAIGMTWDNSVERKSREAWEARYAEAKRYFETHGDLAVPAGYIGADGRRLKPWILTQRRAYASGKLSEEQIDRLSAIGMLLQADDSLGTGHWHAAYCTEKARIQGR